jgi:HK97 family phage major capsid protein
MASSNLKRLQDRAAAVAARLNELADIEERSEEQTAELRRLTDEADKVQSDLKFEQQLAAKEAELRAVVERAAPAKAEEPAAEKVEKKVEIRHILPHHTSLRAYSDGPDAVKEAYGVGRWIRATVFRNENDLRWCRENGIEARALSEGTNSAGGFLVPQEFAARVIRLVETYGTMPGAAERVTLARDVMTIPKRATGSTAYFVNEGSSITESDPSWTNVTLNSKKLAVACRMSSEVMEDSASYINIADAVTQEFATSLALKIDQSGWNGDGTSGHGGITGITEAINVAGTAGSIVTAASGNVSFETLDVEDFLNVLGKLPIYARAGAKWYISPAGYAASMSRLKYAAGGNTVDNVSGGAGETFLGYPVQLVHVLNSTLGAGAAGSELLCLFGNMGLSSIYASRREFSVKLYDQVYATTDQLLLQGTMRFDINHHSLGSSTEAGPVIGLKSAAT